jgi:hypothetical protein
MHVPFYNPKDVTFTPEQIGQLEKSGCCGAPMTRDPGGKYNLFCTECLRDCGIKATLITSRSITMCEHLHQICIPIYRIRFFGLGFLPRKKMFCLDCDWEEWV